MATGNIFESNEPQQGERATENAHRKLELQSPQDLAYLVAAAQREALKKLDKHFPPDAAPEGEDEMRKRIAELVYNVSFGAGHVLGRCSNSLPVVHTRHIRLGQAQYVDQRHGLEGNGRRTSQSRRRRR